MHVLVQDNSISNYNFKYLAKRIIISAMKLKTKLNAGEILRLEMTPFNYLGRVDLVSTDLFVYGFL